MRCIMAYTKFFTSYTFLWKNKPNKSFLFVINPWTECDNWKHFWLRHLRQQLRHWLFKNRSFTIIVFLIKTIQKRRLFCGTHPIIHWSSGTSENCIILVDENFKLIGVMYMKILYNIVTGSFKFDNFCCVKKDEIHLNLFVITFQVVNICLAVQNRNRNNDWVQIFSKLMIRRQLKAELCLFRN